MTAPDPEPARGESDAPAAPDPAAGRGGVPGRAPAARYLDQWEAHLSLTATAGVRRPPGPERDRTRPERTGR